MNAQDSLTLLTFLLVTGPRPLLRMPHSYRLVESITPFLKQLQYLWRRSGKDVVSKPLLVQLQDLLIYFGVAKTKSVAENTLYTENKSAGKKERPRVIPVLVVKKTSSNTLAIHKTAAPVMQSAFQQLTPQLIKHSKTTSSAAAYLSPPPTSFFPSSAPLHCLPFPQLQQQQQQQLQLQLQQPNAVMMMRSVPDIRKFAQHLHSPNPNPPPPRPLTSPPVVTSFITPKPVWSLAKTTDDVAMHKVKFTKPKVGFQNLGNTCYLNSFLQCLFLTDLFTSNVFHFDFPPPAKEDLLSASDSKMLTNLQLLFAIILITNSSSVSVKQVYDVLPEFYRDGHQQDVTEVGRYIFSALGGHELALIRGVFSGQIVTKTKCIKCSYISERSETVHDFGFPVPSEETFESMSSKTKRKVTVQQLFSDLLQEETLDGDNSYSCQLCEKKTKARRWVEILSPPAHLFVCLNRYSWDLSTGERKKERTPVVVDKKIVVAGWHYILYASVIHAGATANSGHYYTVGSRSELLPKDEKRRWFCFDDSRVSSVDPDRIQEIAAGTKADDKPYVLFYKCTKSPLPPTPAIPQSIHRKALKTVEE